MEAVATIVVPPTKDLGGGFEVRRALPSVGCRMVGPFVFFDQMGPAVLRPGEGLDVRPHPHIGLATVTYLYEGELLHRDSLGTVETIRPGELNWMSAGRGIVHSERTPPELRPTTTELFGIQSWVALPRDQEESEPTFAHHGGSELPVVQDKGMTARIIAGELWGARSPVKTFSEMFYVDVTLESQGRVEIPPAFEERAFFVAEGSVEVPKDGEVYPAGRLLVLKPKVAVALRALQRSRVMLLGGPPMDGPRHVRWNFVSSSPERIARAGEDWRQGRFPPVPDETEFIPLPDSWEKQRVRYP